MLMIKKLEKLLADKEAKMVRYLKEELDLHLGEERILSDRSYHD